MLPDARLPRFHGRRPVLVAVPAFLGQLRKNLNASFQSLVPLEVDKDCTALKPDDHDDPGSVRRTPASSTICAARQPLFRPRNWPPLSRREKWKLSLIHLRRL
jgi:hypothetical protein